MNPVLSNVSFVNKACLIKSSVIVKTRQRLYYFLKTKIYIEILTSYLSMHYVYRQRSDVKRLDTTIRL